jgi:hypothetical protein
MADKRQDLARNLAGIQRGPGFRLSTDAPPAEPPPAPSPAAEVPPHPDAEVQNRKKAAPAARVNRGVTVREDLMWELKALALQQRRKLYEVLDEALVEYLRRHGREVAPPTAEE